MNKIELVAKCLFNRNDTMTVEAGSHADGSVWFWVDRDAGEGGGGNFNASLADAVKIRDLLSEHIKQMEER